MSKQTKITRTREEAKKLMWEYYQENKSTLPSWIRECREEIISSLMKGFDCSNAYVECTEIVSFDTVSTT